MPPANDGQIGAFPGLDVLSCQELHVGSNLQEVDSPLFEYFFSFDVEVWA